MAGILDSKERMIDFVITDEGKRQASTGQMKFEYASFTDLHTFYAVSGALEPDVAEDASSRIFFEAGDRYQDVIVPELEAGNSLRPLRTVDFDFGGKVVASGTVRVGHRKKTNVLTGSEIINISEKALSGITRNYNDLRILSTEDPFANTVGFELSQMTGSFFYWNNMPMGRGAGDNVSLEASESLFSDRRFAHYANFKYLPPVNIPIVGDPNGKPIGLYPRLNEPEIMSLNDLMDSVEDSQSLTIEFTDTSRENNLVGQMFEFSSAGVEKLSIIDFGEFGDDDPFSPGKRVFFVGKLYRDANGTETFMNIFTMVFD